MRKLHPDPLFYLPVWAVGWYYWNVCSSLIWTLKATDRCGHYRVTYSVVLIQCSPYYGMFKRTPQIAKFMWPIWGPTGSCRPQMGPCWPHAGPMSVAIRDVALVAIVRSAILIPCFYIKTLQLISWLDTCRFYLWVPALLMRFHYLTV